MDQQNRDTAPRHVPTEAEIARAEAEAVAALQRGEAPKPPTPDGAAEAAEAASAPQPDFVPYVDDVPEAQPAAADDAEEDGEYIPGAWEKRIDALSPEKWRLCQIVGGALVGLAAIASLFVFGEELSMYGLVVAALLALLLPRYLERAWRRKLTTARYAMAAAMLVGLVVIGVVVGVKTGFVFTKQE